MRSTALILFLCCGGLMFNVDKKFLHAQGVELQSASPNGDERNRSATPAAAIPSSINVPFDLPSLVRQVRGAVVLISVYDRNGKLRGKGTGFFVSSDSIATNAHVIEGAATVRAKAEDGTVYEVPQVYGCDPELDIAILKTAKDSGKTVRLQSGNNNVEVGERIAVIGNPLGAFENTVSDGIISGLRKDEAGDWLQITAAVSHGSSGSPVINAAGSVVGIVALGFTEGQSLNFARPAKYLTSLPRKPASFEELAERLQQRVLSDANFKAGLEADSNGNWLIAIKHFNQVLAKFPDNLVVLDALGTCYSGAAAARLSDDGAVTEISEQLLREEVRVYKKILSLDQNNISALEGLSGAYSFLKRPDETIAICRRGLALDDSNASLWLSMAFAFAEKGDLARAQDAAEHAVKVNPHDRNAWDTLATVYHEQGNFRQEREARNRQAAAMSRSSPRPRSAPVPKSR